MSQQLANFRTIGRDILCVIQPSTCSTLGEYDSRPPLARYVCYVTWYLRSSHCSETQYAHIHFRSFYHLCTLDVTHVRKCTRPSPLFRTASDEKLGVGLGTRLSSRPSSSPLTSFHTQLTPSLFLHQRRPSPQYLSTPSSRPPWME